MTPEREQEIRKAIEKHEAGWVGDDTLQHAGTELMAEIDLLREAVRVVARTWAAIRPTVPGWYWLRRTDRSDVPPEVVRVSVSGARLLVHCGLDSNNDGTSVYELYEAWFNGPNAEWIGPMEVPQ